MDLHHVMIFCHVLAMIGLFVALSIEGISLRGVGRATSYEQAREWVRLWILLAPIGLPSVLLVLASGIYLATTFGLWRFGWTQAAVPTLLMVAIAGGVVGPRRNRLASATATNSGALPQRLLTELRHPLLRVSWAVRATLMLALVFEMTTKLDAGSFAVIASAVLVGTAWGAATFRTSRPAGAPS